MIFGSIYSFFEEKLSHKNLLIFTQSFLVLSLLILFILLILSKILNINELIIQILMVWKAIIEVLSGIVFWATASLMFNIRQSKRLFGLLSAGEILAFIIAGLIIPIIVKLIGGTNNLLIISIFGLFIGILMLLIIRRIYPDKFLIKSEKKDFIEQKEEKKESIFTIFKSKYILFFFYSFNTI